MKCGTLNINTGWGLHAPNDGGWSTLHISIVAYGTWGDVRPGVALGLALKDAGYGVRLIVTQDFGEWVNDVGLDVHLLPLNKHEIMQRVSSETNPFRAMLAVHQEIAPALLKAGRSLIAVAHDTDALLVNEWLLGIASGIAETHQLKLINMALQPSIKTRVMPIATMPALPNWAPFRETYNLFTYVVAYYSRWWSYVRIANSLRKNLLNLPPLSPQGYLHLLTRTPSITMVSRHVVPRPTDWEDHRHLTGFLFYDDADWHAPAELEKFIHAQSAPVYVGFGSMHDRRPDETTHLIIDAIARTNRRAVLYSGWANLGRLDLPETIYRLDYAPHSWLFPRMAALVHHGGAGTTAAALRAGIPSVPIPHSGDQPFWSKRLHQIGAGTVPLPRSRLNAVDLADRITTAVDDPQLRRRADILGAKIRAENGAAAIVSAINKILQ